MMNAHSISRFPGAPCSWKSAFFVILVAAGLAGCKPDRTKEGLHESMRKIQKAITERDAKTLSDYLSPAEASQTGLDESKLASFLSGAYDERMKAFHLLPGSKIVLDEPGKIAFQDNYTAPDGRTVAMMTIVQETEDGPKMTPLLTPLMLAYFATWRSPGEGQSPNSLHKAWADGTHNSKDALTKLGLKGLVLNEHSGDHFYDWDEWETKSRPVVKP